MLPENQAWLPCPRFTPRDRTAGTSTHTTHEFDAWNHLTVIWEIDPAKREEFIAAMQPVRTALTTTRSAQRSTYRRSQVSFSAFLPTRRGLVRECQGIQIAIVETLDESETVNLLNEALMKARETRDGIRTGS